MLQESPYTVVVDQEITLRVRTLDEASELFTLIRENKEHLSQFLYWVDATHGILDSKLFIEKLLHGYEKGTSCDFGIYFNEKLIGSGGLIEIDAKNKSCEIGYWIAEAYQGKGIITKSVKKMITIATEKYNIHRIVIRVDVENTKSQSIPKKLGFTYEGTMRDLKIYRDTFRSIEVWSLLV
jgi:ribosomal-protein-serine acetyltransferase